MTKLTRRVFLISAGASAIAAPSIGRAEGPIRFGAIVSATGPASWLGDPGDKTLRMYVEQINAAGGLMGRKIELFIYDDASDAAKANSFAKRLIQQDKVEVILGPSTTGTTMAVIPLAEAANIPVLSCGAANVIVQPLRSSVFKMPHSDTMAAQAVLTDMKARGISRFALLSDTGGFGKSGRTETTNVAKELGLTIVADQNFGERDTDMTPVLTRISGAGAEAVFMFGTGQAPAILARNYRQLNLDMPLYTTHSQASYEFIRIAGPAAEGIRLPTPALLLADSLPASDPQKAVSVSYKGAYEDRFKSDVSTFGGYAYDALMLSVDAMKRANSSSSDKVRAAIEATKGFVGVSGIYSFSPTDHNGLDAGSFRMVEVKGGRFTALS